MESHSAHFLVVPPNSQYCDGEDVVSGFPFKRLTALCAANAWRVGISFVGEESYLLLEGESRCRSRSQTWAGGRPRHSLFRPWRWDVWFFGFGVVVSGEYIYG